MLLSLLAGGLVAGESGLYVGVDMGNTAFDMKASALSASVKDKDDGGSQTVKGGYYFDRNSRLSAFFQNINVENGEGQLYGAGYDYLIGDDPFKPFVGVLAGYGSFDDDAGEVSLSGYLYGAQAGVNYELNEDFSIEGGYRYIVSKVDGTVRDIGTGINVTIEVDPVTNWFIGVNYKF